MAEIPTERRKDDPRVRQLIEDVAAVKVEVGRLSHEVAANTALTQEVKVNTAGVVTFLNESEQAFKLFNRVMSALRWFLRKAVIPLALVVGAFWAISHDGRPPEWLKSWIDLFRK